MSLFPTTGSNGRRLVLFWQLSRRFWFGGRWSVIGLGVLLLGVVLLQLLVQVSLNLWNRNFFDALERRDGYAMWAQAELFFPLAAASVVLAATSVWGRMTTQRTWREAMTRDILESWAAKRHDGAIADGIDGAENPEYRIAEDVRVATDAPVDLSLAFISSGLTATTFFGVLWTVGGSIEFQLFGHHHEIHGYLVLGVVLYSTLMTSLMLLLGRRMPGVIETKNQAEAEFRAAAEILRGDHAETPGMALAAKATLLQRLGKVLATWRELCWQLASTTLVSQANFLFAPIAAYILCVPKYASGAMTLGEVTQSAAAFVTVQGAINWLVDNYQRLADWRSSAHRVSSLLLAIDNMEDGRDEAPSEADASVPDPAAPRDVDQAARHS
ncbi:MAG TPA: SbmA/BacA-like family transporter [Rhodopseudomonas sp.]|uniref:SbmA/BacA-like family transporter n=1 Tax=Rhodopseudomonas sp. TaxID=1078 RepID=UPI002ED88655